MTLAPSEQRVLLYLERSLRSDQDLRAALRAFNCRCYRAADPDLEDMSPWHPVLWRIELFALVTITLAFFALIGLTVCLAF